MGKKYYRIEVIWRNGYATTTQPPKTFIECGEDLVRAIVNNLPLFDISGVKIIELGNEKGVIEWIAKKL